MKFRSRHKAQADAEVEVSVSPETQAMMETFQGDLAAMREMLSDLSDTAAVILERIDSEVAVEVNRVVQRTGVVVEQGETRPAPPQRRSSRTSRVTPEQRQRSSPFTRSPRPEQIAWLESVLADKAWHNANGIAREHAVDEPHCRYMKRAVGARLREMHEEGLVERRDSHEKGAMFEYRIP